MRKRETLKRLNNIISNSVPDVLDNILKSCNEKEVLNREYSIMKEKKENKKIMPRFAYALAFVFICVLSIVGINRYNYYKDISTINFDVNPSVELKIGKDEKVLKVTPLNEDGKKVLGNMNFNKVQLDVAVNAIIGSMLKNGYITVNENSILVSVKNKDVETANKLKEKISNDIDKILNESLIDGAILSQAYSQDEEASKKSDDSKISEGKARLINNIINSNMKDKNGNLYTFESLASLSINELNLLLSSKNTEIKDTKTKGNASENSYIGKEKAKQIALKDAKIDGKSVKGLNIEFDADDGTLVYEVEFKYGNKEYDYEINAKNGNIIDRDVEVEDND